jgi:hypothetical protein
MDKEKREAYDAIAGFTGGAVNPFYDASYERNQVRRYTMCCAVELQGAHLCLPLMLFTPPAGVCQRV